MRFSPVEEPSGTWLVFDDFLERPAEIWGREMIGLSRLDAEELAAEANDTMLRSKPMTILEIRARL